MQKIKIITLIVKKLNKVRNIQIMLKIVQEEVFGCPKNGLLMNKVTKYIFLRHLTYRRNDLFG